MLELAVYFLMEFIAYYPLCLLRQIRTTVAPLFAASLAAEKPIPLLPPVMTNTFWARDPVRGGKGSSLLVKLQQPLIMNCSLRSALMLQTRKDKFYNNVANQSDMIGKLLQFEQYNPISFFDQFYQLFQNLADCMYITTADKLLLLLGLITGATVTFGFTIMNNQKVDEVGKPGKNFFHPYVQVAIRATSNSLCFLPIIVKKLPYQDSGSRFLNPVIILIPTILDFFASYCFYTALNFMPGSVYQMLRGGTVLTTYVFTIVILKVRPKKFKIVGCIIVLFGLMIIGAVNFLTEDEEGEGDSLTGLGYLLIIIGIVGAGLRFIYQERIMRKFNLNPLWMLSLEGVYSTVLSCIIIPVLALTPCPFDDSACVFNDEGEKVIQNASVFFRETFSNGNGLLLTGFVISILSSCLYNGTGVTIAKTLSSLARAVIDVSRTVIVWIVGVALTATLGRNDSAFQYQSLATLTLVGESVGFLFLIFGNFIYYEIIAFECIAEKDTIYTELSKEYMLEPGNQEEASFYSRQQ